MKAPYFEKYERRSAPVFVPMDPTREMVWHFLAGITVMLGAWYIWWRWTESLNPDAMVFSIVVASAETLSYLGTLIFFHDIWREGDTLSQIPPVSRQTAGLDGEQGEILVDVFITTYDEETAVVEPSVVDALNMELPQNVRAIVHILDDGNRSDFRKLAQKHGVNYITRQSNIGFKAGNLRNALFETSGDFVLICDADTRLFSSFLLNTLGYFRDPKLAWVQTPHWFYDIPEGEPWSDWVSRNFGSWGLWASKPLSWITGKSHVGADPFLSDPALFFDVIQRRRNRNGASFCCGAGSIHRREAIFTSALKRKADAVALRGQKLGSQNLGALSRTVELEPYKFHVSEDIYTSMLLQCEKDSGWTSVYHPQIEARMLSPWGMHAWAAQRLKYAGGTVDIMLRDNPILKKGMPWRTKLHYLATFWSYISFFWVAAMLLAPVVSLVSGMAPVQAYSIEFFARFVPVIVFNELAMVAACKGHSIQPGRIMSVATLNIQARAFWMVLRGQRPQFPPTPKTPLVKGGMRYAFSSVCLLVVMLASAIFGAAMVWLGVDGFTLSLLIVNLFWLTWNMLAVGRIVLAALWHPKTELDTPLKEDEEFAHATC